MEKEKFINKISTALKTHPRLGEFQKITPKSDSVGLAENYLLIIEPFFQYCELKGIKDDSIIKFESDPEIGRRYNLYKFALEKTKCEKPTSKAEEFLKMTERSLFHRIDKKRESILNLQSWIFILLNKIGLDETPDIDDIHGRN